MSEGWGGGWRLGPHSATLTAPPLIQRDTPTPSIFTPFKSPAYFLFFFPLLIFNSPLTGRDSPSADPLLWSCVFVLLGLASAVPDTAARSRTETRSVTKRANRPTAKKERPWYAKKQIIRAFYSHLPTPAPPHTHTRRHTCSDTHTLIHMQMQTHTHIYSMYIGTHAVHAYNQSHS